MAFIEASEEEEQGSELFAKRMTSRMRQVERDELAPSYSLNLEETGGCEQDELSDYFRADGQDLLE